MRAGSLSGIQADWNEVSNLLRVDGGPSNKPHYRPFSARNLRDPSGYWYQRNLPGSYAFRSIRNTASFMLDASRTGYGLPVDHAQQALALMLKGTKVPAWALAAFYLRDYAFTLDPPGGPDDLVDAFKEEYLFNQGNDFAVLSTHFSRSSSNRGSSHTSLLSPRTRAPTGSRRTARCLMHTLSARCAALMQPSSGLDMRLARWSRLALALQTLRCSSPMTPGWWKPWPPVVLPPWVASSSARVSWRGVLGGELGQADGRMLSVYGSLFLTGAMAASRAEDLVHNVRLPAGSAGSGRSPRPGRQPCVDRVRPDQRGHTSGQYRDGTGQCAQDRPRSRPRRGHH